jgi:hypothetical protein
MVAVTTTAAVSTIVVIIVAALPAWVGAVVAATMVAAVYNGNLVVAVDRMAMTIVPNEYALDIGCAAT